jgi:hypothetical protein
VGYPSKHSRYAARMAGGRCRGCRKPLGGFPLGDRRSANSSRFAGGMIGEVRGVGLTQCANRMTQRANQAAPPDRACGAPSGAQPISDDQACEVAEVPGVACDQDQAVNRGDDGELRIRVGRCGRCGSSRARSRACHSPAAGLVSREQALATPLLSGPSGTGTAMR